MALTVVSWRLPALFFCVRQLLVWKERPGGRWVDIFRRQFRSDTVTGGSPVVETRDCLQRVARPLAIGANGSRETALAGGHKATWRCPPHPRAVLVKVRGAAVFFGQPGQPLGERGEGVGVSVAPSARQARGGALARAWVQQARCRARADRPAPRTPHKHPKRPCPEQHPGAADALAVAGTPPPPGPHPVYPPPSPHHGQDGGGA